jgi:hypothetical protein
MSGEGSALLGDGYADDANDGARDERWHQGFVHEDNPGGDCEDDL